MARTVSIGTSDFEKIRTNDAFYVDKTYFISQWWDALSDVTAIMRPRRFGKTLTLSMVECFFSVKYADRKDLFEGLDIWKSEKFRNLQGTYPVLFLSFTQVKKPTFKAACDRICLLIRDLFRQNHFLLDSDLLNDVEKDDFKAYCAAIPYDNADIAVRTLMSYLAKHYGKKVIILLDEYDTPLQEAYLNGYWKDLVGFLRPFFEATFKENPFLERGLLTGITRVAKESIFSDLNALEVVTTTSEQYEDCFGFTQDEVLDALQEYGLMSQKDRVRKFYDGFTFGQTTNIYNPWSIINFLKTRRFLTFWVNTSSNALVSELIRTSDKRVKMDCEKLLSGENIHKKIDEQIVFSQLTHNSNALWGFLLASGYLKVLGMDDQSEMYTLALTNEEVKRMFKSMVRDWFADDSVSSSYLDFLDALVKDDVDGMNNSLNKVTQSVFSFFDTKGREPERFYHGFVLGLMVYLDGNYILRSNRESGFGRYDVILEPRGKMQGNAVIFELKVRDIRTENSLKETVHRALDQIEKKHYDLELLDKGYSKDQIKKYGFAFDGKTVLIGSEDHVCEHSSPSPDFA